MKKKILIAYPEYYLGGSTTSLQALLNTFDYDSYEVDLVVYRHTKKITNLLPEKVNYLGEVAKYKRNNWNNKILFLFHYFIKGYFFKAFYFEFKTNRKIKFNEQILSKIAADESVKINKKYDIAIGFLEYWGNDYVMRNVKADTKIAWLHTDYSKAGYIPSLDIQEFTRANNIVFVSNECLKNFEKIFPDLSSKLVVIQNIISSPLIHYKSNQRSELIDKKFGRLNIITVCRLDIYTKGIDRIISNVKKVVEEGFDLKWYIIGAGSDHGKIIDLIKNNNLEDTIILLGRKDNPYPYLKECDLFAMPSRYEGKPIAVTEAQVMGLPILVTNYSSANEQVNHGFDGYIIENNDDSLYYGLKSILENPNIVKEFRKNLKKRSFSNEKEILNLYRLFP